MAQLDHLESLEMVVKLVHLAYQEVELVAVNKV